MRKYCARCGTSLIKQEEEPAPEPIEELEESSVAETPSFTEDDRHVLPSQVASEQVEMEREVPAPHKTSEASSHFEVPDESDQEEIEASKPQSMDYDKGREVVKDILEKVRAAEARSRGEEAVVSSETETDLEAPPEEEVEEIDEPTTYEESVEEYDAEEPTVEEYEVEEPTVEEIEPPPPVEKPEVVRVVKEPPSVSIAAHPKLIDEKVRMLESDIKSYNIELEQLKSELNKLRKRLDEEVERYLVAAETKRSRAESLERELKLAKNEYKEADKEYKNADNRRKKELSNAEKRISEVEKRIRKAEESKEKRIVDLEKERLKREEAAGK